MKVKSDDLTSFWRATSCLQSSVRVLSPVVQAAGETLRKLGELLSELKVPDYTSLWHRFQDLELEVPESSDDVTITVGLPGSRYESSEWLRKTHRGKQRGWIKVHVAIDVENKELLSIEVTDEKTGDSKVFEDLVRDLDLEDCLADSRYDSVVVFKLLVGKAAGRRESKPVRMPSPASRREVKL